MNDPVTQFLGSNDVHFVKMMDIIKYRRTHPLTKIPGGSKNCDYVYCETHHIIPRSFFKYHNLPVDNSNENLVNLTAGEHLLVHYYLMEHFHSIGNEKLEYAMLFSCNQVIHSVDKNHNTDILNEKYIIELSNVVQHIKADFSAKISYWSSHVRRRTIGYRHVHNPKTGQSMFINRDLSDVELSDGWKYGCRKRHDYYKKSAYYNSIFDRMISGDNSVNYTSKSLLMAQLSRFSDKFRTMKGEYISIVTKRPSEAKYDFIRCKFIASFGDIIKIAKIFVHFSYKNLSDEHNITILSNDDKHFIAVSDVIESAIRYDISVPKVELLKSQYAAMERRKEKLLKSRYAAMERRKENTKRHTDLRSITYPKIDRAYILQIVSESKKVGSLTTALQNCNFNGTIKTFMSHVIKIKDSLLDVYDDIFIMKNAETKQRTRLSYTDEEIAYMKNHTVEECVRKLNRHHRKSIMLKMHQLGVRKPYRIIWSQNDDMYLQNHTVDEAFRHFNQDRSIASIKGRIYRIKLNRNPN